MQVFVSVCRIFNKNSGFFKILIIYQYFGTAVKSFHMRMCTFLSARRAPLHHICVCSAGVKRETPNIFSSVLQLPFERRNLLPRSKVTNFSEKLPSRVPWRPAPKCHLIITMTNCVLPRERIRIVNSQRGAFSSDFCEKERARPLHRSRGWNWKWPMEFQPRSSKGKNCLAIAALLASASRL